MSVQITLPDDLAAQIDGVSDDRDRFVTDAVRRELRKVPSTSPDEGARINEPADELNQEATEVQLFLEDLVAKITPRNRHSEVETGKAVGNEVW